MFPIQTHLILGTTLNKEIDNELNSYLTLIDPGLNQFEVVVDKYDGKLYFSHGIEELNKAYKLEHGGWISLIYAFPQLFVIRVHDRHNYEIKYPSYLPPLRLRLAQLIYGPNAAPGSVQIDYPAPYPHICDCFKFSVTKWLTLADVTSDQLVYNLYRFSHIFQFVICQCRFIYKISYVSVFLFYTDFLLC